MILISAWSSASVTTAAAAEATSWTQLPLSWKKRDISFFPSTARPKGIAGAGLLFEIDCAASNFCTSVRADTCTATNSALVTQWSEASDRYQRPL